MVLRDQSGRGGKFMDQRALRITQVLSAILAERKKIAAMYHLLGEAQAILTPQPFVAEEEQVEQTDQRPGVTAHLAPGAAAVLPADAKTRDLHTFFELIDANGLCRFIPQQI